MGSMRYFVFFTPIDQVDQRTYLSEIDVSDRIKMTGIGSIRRSIDAADYDIGVFTFSDLELVGLNFNGYFNEEDSRSIFPSGRDLCKVRVVFENVEMVRNSSGTVLSETITDTVTFRGLINEEGTRLDLTTETIRFKVLSRDSVLRTTKISSGVVVSGMSFKQALEAILNVPRITSVLNFDADNIQPKLNLTIDEGDFFDDKSVKEALDKLLFASNSVLLIEDIGDIIVKSRDPLTTRPLVSLYSKNDLHRRENVIDITAYNQGKQRMFTSVVINDFERSNSAFVQTFGLRQKKFDLDFITDSFKAQTIADELVDEFKTPKIELNVKVSTELSKTIQLLDRVSVNYPLRTKPIAGTFLPIIGVTVLGDSEMPLPEVFGSIEIPARFAFKVIEIEDNPEKFTSILKLRQMGKNLDDGVFDTPNSCILGFSTLGFAPICEGGAACDTWNPSVLGAALMGCTVIS